MTTHLVMTSFSANIGPNNKCLEIILIIFIIDINNTPPATRKLSALRGVNYFYSMVKGFSLHADPQSPITFVQQVDFLSEPKALNFD